MANLISTVHTYELDGSTTEYPIHFDYLARKFVVVTLIGQDRKVLKLNEDYRFAEKRKLSLTRAWGVADGYDLIEIRRITSATDRLVDFSDGSILRAIDLNISAIQALHVAEEARDLTADTIAINNDGDLDARGKRIVNVADAIDDGDALNLRTVKSWNESALTAQEAAKRYSEVSLAHSKESERQKNLSLNAAKSSREAANESAASASESASSANDSAGSALQSSGSALKSEDCMEKACECASKAAISEKNAKDSEESAKQYKEDAGNEANRAKSEADRAEQAADDAVAGGIKPSELTQTITTDKFKAPSNFAVNTALNKKLNIIGGELTGTLKFNHENNTIYDSEHLSSAPRGSKNYLRKMRGGLSDVLWHETVDSTNYRLSTGATDSKEIFKLHQYSGAYVLGNKVVTEDRIVKDVGDSDTNVMTQKAVSELLLNTGIGTGQTWYAHTPSVHDRVGEVWYTNDTGKPILVSITGWVSSPTKEVVYAEVDDVRVSLWYNVKTGSRPNTASFIVPNGSKYGVFAKDNAKDANVWADSENRWAELR